MRFNKLELIAIASQASLNFDREGILVVKERQEGFFRRSEICTKRWFRLRGNLLFYLRGQEQCSEPMGVIVLEHFTVQPQPQDDLGHWPFQIVWDGGICYKLAAFSKLDRASWLKFIQMASYEHMRLQIITLQERLERIKPTLNMDIGTWREIKGVVIDMNEVPLCELSLSCDNLLCDAYGRPPSPMITVHVQYPNGQWVRYASTEVIEMCSNPSFSRTIIFRSSDDLTGQSLIKIAVYNMREQLSQTAVPMGFADLLLSTIQDTQRLRITLNSHNKDVGFVTLNCWSLEPSYYNGASPKHGNGPNSMDLPQKPLSHRRSHSLPPRLGMKLKLPSYGNAFKQNFANPYQVTYRFHSGLGGDITVHEIMAESKLCFQMPINLLGLYIQREKELLQEVICMGELGGQWKFRQMELLDTHLSLLKHYSHARQSLQVFLQSSSGKFFKPSPRKDDSSLEFAPVNLHLQRIWAHNDTLNKSGFHDIVTVGAFTAHTHKAGKAGGLIRLVQELKDISSIKAPFNSPSASRVQMACDAVQAIKQLRGEIVDIMAKLLALAKVKQSIGMMQLAEDMIVRTRTLLTLWDPGLVEEALSFIDRHKMHQSVATNLPGIPIKDRPQHLSPFKQLTDQLSKLDLRSPELEDFATPCTPNLNKMVWPSSDAGKLHISAPSVYSAEDSKSKNSLENMKAEKSGIEVQGQPIKELEFHNDHFDKEAEVYANLEQFHSLNFHKTSNDFYQSSPIDQPFNSNTTKSYSESPDSEVHIKTSERRHTLSKHSTSLDHEFYAEKISEANDSLVFQMSLEENGNVECKQEVKNKNELDRDVIDNVASNDPIAKQYLDVTTMTNSPSANYYQPSDEPEPWDLTQLNIEASVMCLVSKVKFLCGRCGSPAIRLRNQKSVQAISVTKDQLKSYDADHPEHSETKIESNTNIDAKHSTYMSAAMDTDNALNAAVDTVQKVVKKGNKFTDGLKLSEVYEWSDELRPPMRKLRQAMDGLLKSGRLAHAVLRLRCESVQRTRAHAALQVRRDTCFSQALTTTATGLLCWFWTASQDVIVPLLEAGLGPLCSFEGLLSLYRSEKAMWGDMVVAIEDLQTVLFTLINSNRGSNIVPHVTGSRCAFNVLIPVPDSLYAKFNSKQHLSFTITAVFFNVGINEKATVAEALGETVPQEQSNADNFDRLNKYYNTYKRIFPADYTNISRASSRVKPLEEVMENLKVAVQRKAAKNVEILQLAALATRQMNGIRVTSCKSAKDRTGMSVTLEQCTILANEYHLAEHEFEKALNCMRSEGCRRENAYKNIGVKKYAFNKLQILALPKKYRPPHGSYGSSQT